MSFGVGYGMKRWIMKAPVVIESVEWTPVRYRLSMRSGEWLGEIGRSIRGLWRSRRREGW
jgi:hypothetical protein